MCFAWHAQGLRHVAKYVAGAGVREGCKNVGRRGGFEEGLERFVLRGRRSDFALCDVDVWSLWCWNRGRVANFMSRKCYFAVIISRGSYRTSYASAQLFRGRRSTFKASTWKSLKRNCNSEAKSLVNLSFLKEVSHKSFVFELQSFIFEGSLAEKLRFWASKLHFWRKSRRNASFLSFKASFLKEVSQKCFLFEFQSVFLEEVSQKSFVWQNYLNHTSVNNQITWTSNHFISKSLESQINWQPTHLISNRLTTKSLEPQIILHPNHLNLKSIDNQLI